MTTNLALFEELLANGTIRLGRGVVVLCLTPILLPSTGHSISRRWRA